MHLFNFPPRLKGTLVALSPLKCLLKLPAPENAVTLVAFIQHSSVSGCTCHTGCTCLIFLHTVRFQVSPQIACLWKCKVTVVAFFQLWLMFDFLTLYLCAFSNILSNCLPLWMQIPHCLHLFNFAPCLKVTLVVLWLFSTMYFQMLLQIAWRVSKWKGTKAWERLDMGKLQIYRRPKYLEEAKTTQHTLIPVISSKISPLGTYLWSSTLFELPHLSCVERCAV